MGTLSLESFKDIYIQLAGNDITTDINLFDTIHLGENDHTNILWTILRYKSGDKHPFLQSFVKQVLGLNWDDARIEEIMDVNNGSKTQYPGLAMKNPGKNRENKGFIDLVLKTDKEVIIIESKACDAPDGKLQLARYYYTFFNHSSYPNINSKGKIHIVYLTKDENKVPSLNSMPEWFIKYILNCSSNDFDYTRKDDLYIPINYQSNILPWLKTVFYDVNTDINRSKMQKSIGLYIDYLENTYLNDENENIYSEESLKKLFDRVRISSLYKEFLKYIEDNNSQTGDGIVCRAYKNCLKYYIDKKLTALLIQGNWCVHFAPSYIQLFREDWEKHHIHFELRGFASKNTKWDLHIEGKEICEKIKSQEIYLQPIQSKDATKHSNNNYCYVGIFSVNTKKNIMTLDDNTIQSILKSVLESKAIQEGIEVVNSILTSLNNQ